MKGACDVARDMLIDFVCLDEGSREKERGGKRPGGIVERLIVVVAVVAMFRPLFRKRG